MSAHTEQHPDQTGDHTGDQTGDQTPDTSFFTEARRQATTMLDDPAALLELAREASTSGAVRNPAFDAVIDDYRTMIRLVVAHARDTSPASDRAALVQVVAALIYVVRPTDLLPDDLPGGFLDDAHVVAWVSKAARSDLEGFRAWEEGRA